MANLAVLASGSGSNFEAIAEKVVKSRHSLVCMICDVPGAFVFERASKFEIPAYNAVYSGRKRMEAEEEIASVIEQSKADIIALAGFMKLLTPAFVDRFAGRIINIHPSLLPKYPGTHGIEDSFNSGDSELGITIHRVDHGLDTGPVIMQKSFIRNGREPLDEIERRIHELEHRWYPEVLIEILNSVD